MASVFSVAACDSKKQIPETKPAQETKPTQETKQVTETTKGSDDQAIVINSDNSTNTEIGIAGIDSQETDVDMESTETINSSFISETDEPSTTSNDTQVEYRCADGKSISVLYQFSEDGLPTFAEFAIDGEVHTLPLNGKHTDEIDTMFGDESTYTLVTNFMSQDNILEKSILITAPSKEIIFTDCSAN